MQLGVVPVINENDTVVYEEIKFGDNDTLGALVANLTEADCLIILTDQNGLYTADPRKDASATLISEGDADDPRFESMAGGAGSGISRGGMITKVRAARRAARSGADTVIASGRESDVLLRLVRGEALGSFLLAGNTPLAARKQWLADHLQTGRQAGARRWRRARPARRTKPAADRCGRRSGPVRARRRRGLPGWAGHRTGARPDQLFSVGNAPHCAQTRPADIESLLGYVDTAELIHRDNMVLA
jgi:glutamate 5-kinase